MNKNYRIHTNIISDTLLHVNMRQDFDFMEILSLKLSQKDAYKLHSSNYGVIIGRVLANDAFGIPNAKISVFIERDDNDTTDMENIYPYEEITGWDKEGRRYNLLPDDSDDECYRIVGTFPNKRLLLDDNTYLEVYDKYWKYSTVTNNAGDYMIFGVPVGSQQIHVDIDMSDIGILSQKPRDYTYKGYTETLFDSSTQFKKSTNLDNLTQIFSQNKSVYVYPFWGDADNGVAAITRTDIQINYKFEPTCVFIGSIVSDNNGNIIDHKCEGSKKSGFNRQLVAGEGTIEMIRKTTDGLVEEYPIQGNRLIDSDGVWCYQIPMNLDYVGTDEYGNIVPTDNPSKGIPTRTQVRFRISKTETGDEGYSVHTAKLLVPMNPILSEDNVIPTTEETTGQEMERMYNFGSNTPQSCFRDLYWNNVYSVKSFIPKTQTTKKGYSPYYNALKACNAVDNQNPIPFNKLMINIPFTYMFICLLYTIVVTIISVVNTVINVINAIIALINSFLNLSILGVQIFYFPTIGYVGCVPMQTGPNNENKVYYPGCDSRGMAAADCPEDMDSCKKVNDTDELMDIIQQNLGEEYDVVRLDLYQDWLNGCLYMPLWLWRKTKKKKFLFFTIRSAQNEFCSCDKEYSKLKTNVTCNMEYINNSLGTDYNTIYLSETKWHKTRNKSIGFFNGLIKRVENSAGEYVYYYSAFQPSSNNKTKVFDIKKRKKPFEIVRLFATDIILLGNLNKSNIYGIPQLFDKLPSTTSNVPPIATIEESDEAETDTKKKKVTEKDNDMKDLDETGKTIVTGMDWGHSGADDSPIYKKGLLLDLACLYANTRSKACINVERMSELGVTLDMSYKMTYARGNDLVEGVIDSDGFINKFEINDNEARAMFATLNHIGFVPQDYQDEKNMYTTQVTDDNTNYLVPKFKYIYPVDFDGRMKLIMDEYENGFMQPLIDNTDESYLTFRFGAEKDENHGRKRHFYYHDDRERTYEMPLYNNSFYFYFGINKGNTAIDKFNNKFIAPCVKETKNPFTINFETQGKVECTEIYDIESYKTPFIKIKIDDIQVPYSYELLDSNGNLVINEINKVETEFKIPDFNSSITRDVEISNQTYTLKVRDGNGKKMTERITVSTPNVGFNYEVQKLGTKFYDTDTTRIDYICSDNTMAYGKIMIDSFFIDGYEFAITDASGDTFDEETNSYTMIVSGVSTSKDEETDELIFVDSGTTIEMVISTNELSVFDCMCDKENNVATEQHAVGMIDSWYNVVEVGEGDDVHNVLELYIYQPNSFIINVTELCNGEPTTNTTNELIVVTNGAIFNAYLNKMPLRFMLGTLTDNINGDEMNKSNFYRTDVVQDPYGDGLKGWFGVHDESVYKFPATQSVNIPIWMDYVDFNGLITSVEVKRKLLKYKFETMFSVAEATYVTTASSNRFEFRGQGGVGIPLNRTVYPVYDDSILTKNEKTTYVLNERSVVIGSKNFPNIVGNNFKNVTDPGPNFDPYVNSRISFYDADSHRRQGNYFAVFSNNGGYTGNTGINDKLPVIKQPSFAKLTPREDEDVKRLGKDEKDSLVKFKPAYQKINGKSLPYFRAMFVDRRLDFDLIIFGPATGQKMNLYPYSADTEGVIHECDFERIWKNARISGLTYGGIEMAYDDGNDTFMSGDTSTGTEKKLEIVDTMFGRHIQEVLSKQKVANVNVSNRESKTYNTFEVGDDIFIINKNVWKEGNTEYTIGTDGYISRVFNDYKNSETAYTITSGEEYNILTAYSQDYTVSASPRGDLEYTYEYNGDNDEDVKTRWNTGTLTPRRLYEASLNGIDIRDAFWSTERREEMNISFAYQGSIKDHGVTEGYYFRYPYANPALYNGYFTGDMNINYPSKRYIDVGNLPALNGYSDMYLTSCSYNTKPRIDEYTGELKMQTVAGESINMDFDFGDFLIMASPQDVGVTRYPGNVVYNYEGGGQIQDYYTLKCANIYVYFTIKPFEVDGYKIYNHAPRVIQVLPYITYDRKTPCYGEVITPSMSYGLDGISYIKMTCPYPLDPHSGRPEYEGVNKPLDGGDGTINRVTWHTFSHTLYNGILSDIDTSVPDTIRYMGELELKDGTMVYDKFLYYAEGDKPLTSDEDVHEEIMYYREISVDVDVFTIMLQREYEPIGNDTLRKRIRTIETSSLFDCRNLIFRPDTREASENCTTYVEYYEDATGKQTFVQTLGFRFKFNEAPRGGIYTPNGAQCQAFADIESMTYTFRIRSESESEDFYFDIPATIAEYDVPVGSSYGYLILACKWPEIMGIILDKLWNGKLAVSIFGKTKEGFTYAINNVRFEAGAGFSRSDVHYDPETKTGTGFREGVKYAISGLIPR